MNDNIHLLRPVNRSSTPARVYKDFTNVVHGGNKTNTSYGPLALPIVTSTTFNFNTLEEIHRYEAGELAFCYSRYGNPTINTCEDRLAALEGAENAVLFNSGMSAVTTTLLSLLAQGDHLIIGGDCYRRTRQFCESFLKRFGIATTVVEMGDYVALEQAILPNTKLIVSESPTNPFLRIVDLEKLVAIAKRHKVVTLIDSTFATPLAQRPLEFGIDLVLHSATKFLGGHNDLISGVICGSTELLTEIRAARGVYGTIGDSHTAAQLERSLKTLAVRMQQHNVSALKIAQFLEEHPGVSEVWYPGLPSHPDHRIAKEQMHSFGGVITFTVAGDLAATTNFMNNLKLAKIADSLGSTESMVKHLALMGFYRSTPEERQELGITDNLIRLSVGLEDTADIIEDLKNALETVPVVKQVNG